MSRIKGANVVCIHMLRYRDGTSIENILVMLAVGKPIELIVVLKKPKNSIAL